MEEVAEIQATHQEPEEEAPKAYTLEEIEDIKKRAEVSSQNFERLKKAEEEKARLIAENETLKAQSGYTFQDDTDVLAKVAKLEETILKAEIERKLTEVFEKYPVLADKKVEFDSYRTQFPTDNFDTVAKLFLAEYDLLPAPKRKGLEKPGGGQRTIPESGKMTSDDAKKLRQNNPRQYMKMVKEGKIQIAD
jgi:hypothetical protein